MGGAAALGGTAAVAETDNKHQEQGRKVLAPALAAGGAVAAIKGQRVLNHLRANAGEIGDYGMALANLSRVSPAKALARGKGFRGMAGKSMLHGLI
jgi:hypothetical protein